MILYVYMMYRYDQQTKYRCLNFGSVEIFQTATSNRSVSALCKQYRTSSIGTLAGFKRIQHIQQLQWLQCVSSFSDPSFIWVNYNISLTWIKAILGWFPLLTMIHHPEVTTASWQSRNFSFRANSWGPPGSPGCRGVFAPWSSYT